jgi:hypothetical protein
VFFSKRFTDYTLDDFVLLSETYLVGYLHSKATPGHIIPGRRHPDRGAMSVAAVRRGAGAAAVGV